MFRTDHKVCYGCTRDGVVWTATGYKCPVWADQTKITMVRQGECFFNRNQTEKSKKRVRVGQQKQRKF
jgi:hypothetical protein